MDKLGLAFGGTEHYKDGRYGMKEISYYIKPGIIEARQARAQANDFIVTRYLVAEGTLNEFAAKVRELARTDRKSARGHDELMRLVNSSPRVCGFVSISEIDSHDRKVTISSGVNLPNEFVQGDWSNVFRL